MATLKYGFVVAVAVLFCATVSTVVFGGDGKDFSHKQHLEEGAECGTCHEAPGEKPVQAATCTDCHDEGPPAWKLPKKALRLKVKFSHQVHADSVECIDCHKLTAEESQTAGEPMMGQSRCTSCHEENGVEVGEGNCVKCHGVNQRGVAPDDHKKAWLDRHGREADWRVFGDHGKECSLCHRKEACLTCHKTSRPRSHTSLWRLRTHGLAASWDRDTCKACHETGTCVRCHKTTAPMNHRGAWKAAHGLAAQTRDNQHCTACHSRAWCAACHAGGGQ